MKASWITGNNILCPRHFYVPTLLIRNDLFKSDLATLSYTGNLEESYPELKFNNPLRFIFPVYYETSIVMFSYKSECNMQPQK
jgi:hypothetical protein